MNSRIPKFRIWDKKRKAFFPMHPCFNSASQSVSITTGYIPKHDNATHNDVRDSENFEFCQSTGLKDVNGIEIFEGDVVQGYFAQRNYISIVEFDIKIGQFRTEKQALCDIAGVPEPKNENDYFCKIIGNIYESN